MFCRRPTHRPPPRGIAVVELAILLPILVTIVFGTIEICSVIRLQQRLNVMAYECARIGVISGSTIADVQRQCNLLAGDDGLIGVDVTTTPNTFETLQSGDWLTANVSLSLAANSPMVGKFFTATTLSESVSIQVP